MAQCTRLGCAPQCARSIGVIVGRADSKGFVMLAIDTTPGYTDTQPFPSAPAKWTYQAIYRVADNRVGQ